MVVARTLVAPATYADIAALPAGITGQLIDGVLYAHARPAAPHAVATSRLGAMLSSRFDLGGGGADGVERWLVLDEPELHLGPHPDVLVPDLAGWRRVRLPRRPTEAHFTLPPDWVCEALSPGTARLDRMLKLPVYAREGVGHVWLLDPLEQSIEVFALDGRSWRLVTVVGGGRDLALPPFEVAPLDLDALWAD